MSAEPLLQLALKEIGTTVPSSQSVLRVAVKLAEAANRLPNMKGRAKLDLVLKTLRDVLAVPEVAARIPEEARAPLTLVVDTIVPDALTLVIEAGRGQFDLKKPSVGCLARLCGLACRRVAVRVGGEAGVALTAAAATVEAVAVGIAEEKKPEAAAATEEKKPETPAPADATEPAQPAPPAPVPAEKSPLEPAPSAEKL
jgi:hypothetical protein